MRHVILSAALLVPSALATPASAQIATPGGFARTGVAGPMTARGGFGDRMNAGAAIPSVRLAPGGITRPAPYPREYGYGYGGAGYGYGGGRGIGGYGYGSRRAWVYDRPWERDAFAFGGGRYRP